MTSEMPLKNCVHLWILERGTIEESQTEDKDWINNWKEFFHQFYVDDILIVPSWGRNQRRR